MKEIELKPEDIVKYRIATINFSTDLGSCLIYVETSDDETPNFHLSNDKYDFKISIFTEDYWSERLLSVQEEKELHSFLQKSDNNMPELYEYSDSTIWERIRDTWISACSYYSDYDKYFTGKEPMPMYSIYHHTN